MQIQSVNNYGYSNTNFKRSIAVFPMVDGVLATERETCKTLLIKTEHLLNDSLNKNVNSGRNLLIKDLRDTFKEWVTDFKDKVKLFTCVCGGRVKGDVYPFGYFTTGNERQILLDAEKKLVEAKKKSGGYITAERRIAESNYRSKGAKMVTDAFREYNPKGNGAYAMVPKFETVKDKNGIIIEGKYNYVGVDFLPVNPKTLTLQLGK